MHDVHVKHVGLLEGGEIVAVVDFPHDDLKGHRVVMQPEALVDRQLGYGLDNPSDAFDAIVREHTLRLCDHIDPESNSHVDQMGGLHSKITVKHARHRLGAVLAFHESRMKSAAVGWSRAPYADVVAPAAAQMPDEHRDLLLEEGP